MKPDYTTGPVPKEAVDYFRSKGWKVGFDHQDVWKEEHAIAFTVAKATEMDVLESIRGAVDSAIAEGKPFRDFQKDLTPTLQKLGWWGKQEKVDPVTGEKRPVQLGSPRRLQTIYQQNLRSAQSAGQWERIERTQKALPYLRYRIGPSEHHRVEHVAWDGLVLPADDSWWNTHFTPNGWGCQCWIQQLSQFAADKLGGPVPAPKVERVPWTNPRTGKTELVPKGITPGFDFNPGKARLRPHCAKWAEALPKLVEPKDLTYPDGTRPPMPVPRKWNGPLTYDGSDDAALINAFLKPFGGKVGKGAVFIDKTNWPLVMDENLFRTGTGEFKVTKGGRHKYLKILSETLRDPDEIWMRWEQVKDEARPDYGSWKLRRTYLSRWETGDGQRSGFSAMTMEDGEWIGRTVFPAGNQKKTHMQDDYLERQRSGLLMYRRK
jgi:hypothetical protein